MQIGKIAVRSFRLFEEESLTFEPGINFILGENAKGKTTWLEALYLLISGKSFRTSQAKDLFKDGESFLKVEVHFEKWGIPQHLHMALHESERRLVYNSTSLASLSGLLGILQGVLLAPHDIELIKGPPATRRHYLDLQIAQVDPLYVHHLMRFSKALKQRNKQLASRKIDTIDFFEETMAHSATYIIQKRELTTQALCELLQHYYHQICTQQEKISLKYSSSLGFDNALKRLRDHREKDLHLGYTALGIHRDDLTLTLSNKPARNFASEGEMRSLAASLKLAEWALMQKKTEHPPLLLVDDMGISLDLSRMHNLYQIFSTLGQVIITATDALPFKLSPLGHKKIYL